MSEASGIPEINFTLNASDVIQQPTDATLTAQGMPADAKAVGERLTEVNETIADLGTDISDLGDTLDNAVLITEQSLEPEEQEQARENIGLGSAAVKGVANNVTTAAAGTDVLDAYQGKVLKDEISDIQDDMYATEIPMSTTDSTKISAKIATMDAAQANAILKTSQPSLTSSEKSVARVNIDAKCLVVTGTMTTTGSLTITNSNITADMVVSSIQVANAGAVPGAITWSTADGSMSLSCSCYAEVGVTVYLVHTA